MRLLFILLIPFWPLSADPCIKEKTTSVCPNEIQQNPFEFDEKMISLIGYYRSDPFASICLSKVDAASEYASQSIILMTDLGGFRMEDPASLRTGDRIRVEGRFIATAEDEIDLFLGRFVNVKVWKVGEKECAAD